MLTLLDPSCGWSGISASERAKRLRWPERMAATQVRAALVSKDRELCRPLPEGAIWVPAIRRLSRRELWHYGLNKSGQSLSAPLLGLQFDPGPATRSPLPGPRSAVLAAHPRAPAGPAAAAVRSDGRPRGGGGGMAGHRQAVQGQRWVPFP